VEGFLVQIVIQSDLTYAPKRFFLAGKAREIIRATLHEKLSGVVYDGEAASGWVREIVDTIRNRLKGTTTSPICKDFFFYLIRIWHTLIDISYRCTCMH
jgi:hypothetical protein